MKKETSLDYCADQVRRHDYPRYLAVLAMPRRTRAALWALYAFHLEIAKIPHIVSEPALGLIRLKWWQEAIERLYQGKPDAHEVIRGIELALQSGIKWQSAAFDELIALYEPALAIDQEFSQEQVDALLLEMSIVTAGEKNRKRLIRLFAYLDKGQRDDPLLALKTWLAACGLLK